MIVQIDLKQGQDEENINDLCAKLGELFDLKDSSSSDIELENNVSTTPDDFWANRLKPYFDQYHVQAESIEFGVEGGYNWIATIVPGEA